MICFVTGASLGSGSPPYPYLRNVGQCGRPARDAARDETRRLPPQGAGASAAGLLPHRHAAFEISCKRHSVGPSERMISSRNVDDSTKSCAPESVASWDGGSPPYA